MARELSQPKSLVLASRSPRRRLLLEQHGFAHCVVTSGVDDGLLAFPERGVSPAGWTAALAWLKARAGVAEAIAGGLGGSLVVLAADTVVVHRGEVIGQPIDHADAHRIVSALAGDEHTVITGIALIEATNPGGTADGGDEPWPVKMLIDRAFVEMGPLGGKAIDEYVASGQWRGKAGGYNLADRLEAGWPIDFHGDPSSIMGLPMRRLAPILRSMVGADGDAEMDRSTDGRRVPDIVIRNSDEHLHDSAGGVFA
ncbi:MAG: Maf family protein [Phycisphaerales bacterium]